MRLSRGRKGLVGWMLELRPELALVAAEWTRLRADAVVTDRRAESEIAPAAVVRRDGAVEHRADWQMAEEEK